MALKGFHHPDLSLPVIRRRVSEELLDVLLWMFEVSATRGRALTWTHWFRSSPAYHSAIYRLRKAGLLISRSGRQGEVFLDLTEAAQSRVTPEMRPRRLWDKKWNGIWYVLGYDVPEKARGYRDAIRGFLRRMRMGRLQRSVWVTPRDIRPEFDDLSQAAGARRFAFLFEARNVLGRSDQDIVESAWDFGRLRDAQAGYCDLCKEGITALRSGTLPKPEVVTRVREEIAAYRLAMADDPLLPSVLWPRGYLGPDVYEFHCSFLNLAGSQM